MDSNRSSMTALTSAFFRAYHATQDTDKLFNDFVARNLFSDSEWTELSQKMAQALPIFDPEFAATNPDEATALARTVRAQVGSVTLPRSRYAEDNLEQWVRQGASQFVILGAGFDTFAYRRTDLAGTLTVFEVDHPATQAEKRARLAGLAQSLPTNLHLVPVDFTTDDLAASLQAAHFDPSAITFFSWFGVSYYLPFEAITTLWRTLSRIAAPGSAVAFDYLDPDAFITGKASRHAELMRTFASRMGEPMQTGLDPAALADHLSACGLHLEEDLDQTAIQHRYFDQRTEGYRAFEHFHFSLATLDGR